MFKTIKRFLAKAHLELTFTHEVSIITTDKKGTKVESKHRVRSYAEAVEWAQCKHKDDIALITGITDETFVFLGSDGIMREATTRGVVLHGSHLAA